MILKSDNNYCKLDALIVEHMPLFIAGSVSSRPLDFGGGISNLGGADDW